MITMANRYPRLDAKLIDFIERQKIFFVATAARNGKVNVSPKGLDTLRVLDDTHLIWLNLTGSGNETAAQLIDCRRMTLMFCSFDQDPLILRVYGEAETLHLRDAAWSALIGYFPSFPGARQIFDMHIELVQTSCGFAVPMFDFTGERKTLETWSNNKGEAGIRQYWSEKNRSSIDGNATGIFED
jgi:hypothetical protein